MGVIRRVSESHIVQCPYKPPLPYVAGQVLTITRHTPPEPFGKPYLRSRDPSQEPRHFVDKTALEDISHSEYCVRFGPVQTQPTPAGGPPETRRIRIVRQIRCKQNYSGMLVVCDWVKEEGGAGGAGGENGGSMVAKIWDPLYSVYETTNSYQTGDPAWLADSDYAKEAAAYQHLQATGHDGEVAPRYHGSWTFQQPIVANWPGGGGQTMQRDVRMILMEHIKGSSMLELMYDDKDEVAIKSTMPCFSDRERILAEALEMEAKCYAWGVHHGDTEPRNIMVCRRRRADDDDDDDKGDGTAMRACLIDFNNAIVGGLPGAIALDWYSDPVERNWSNRRLFEDWLPEKTDGLETWRRWLQLKWGDWDSDIERETSHAGI